MKNLGLISIIVPIYNVNQKDFENCIKSIVNQSYNNLEIILVDDGSKKEIADFCDDIKEIDDRILIFHKKNGGVSSARNFGINKANGDYLSFIDSDDLLDKDMYKILIENINTSCSDISCSGYSYIELDGKEYEKYGTNKKEVLNYEQALSSFFNEDSFGVAVWNKLFRAKIVKNIVFDEDLKINEDRLYFYNAILKSKKIIYEDKCLYKYIKRENSATTNQFNMNRFDVLKVNSIIEESMVKQNFDNKNLLFLWNKNKVIYLIRLYRELILSKMTRDYKNQKKEIISEIKKVYSNDLMKLLNKFDKIETFLIIKLNIFYPVFIGILVKMRFLKKIKNSIEKKSR